MIRIAAAIFLTAVSAFTAQAIVGATAAKDPDGVRRHTVAIVLERGLCTGVLIAQDMILTAAHCFSGSKPKHVVTLDGQFQPRFITVKKHVVHPTFRHAQKPVQSAGVDLAVLHLSRPAPDDMIPAVIGHFGDRGDVFLAGFGISGRARDKTGTLRGAFLRARIVDWKTHRLIAAIGVEGDEAKIGTGGCRGDSGGPLYDPQTGAVVGIVSWSSGTPGQSFACGGLTVATETGDHLAWIQQAIRHLQTAKNNAASPVPQHLQSDEGAFTPSPFHDPARGN